MQAKPYSNYKPSGAAWLGNVPDDWQARRLKFSVSKVGSGITPKGGAEAYEREGIPLLRSQNIHFDGLQLDDVVFISAETHREMANSQVAGGDVVINITGASIGRCCSIPKDFSEANVNQHVCIIRPEPSLQTEYLRFVLWSKAGQAQIDLEQTGSGREGLTFAAVKDFVFPIPELEEQQRIATFLDWKTTQIDALIARKWALLEKLKEERLAIITLAVTRGLDPTAPLRDSGVSWLGKVPQHWKVKRLRFAVERIEQGWSPQCDNQPAGDDCWGVMKVGCVNGDQFDSLENKALPPDLTVKTEYELNTGDILISRANTRELLGSAAMVSDNVRPKLLLCDKLFRLTTPPDFDNEFFTYYLRTPVARFQYEREATGASNSMQNIGQDTIKNLPVVIPPYEEQKLICLEIRRRVARVDAMSTTTKAVIARLTEYRTALITSVTTGKIDVRNVEVPKLKTD